MADGPPHPRSPEVGRVTDPVPTSPAGASCRQDFVQRLTAAQSHLYAFICSLLGSTREAPDVLQETNVLLWQRAADYDADREFLPWAYALARYQVMTHRKR